MPPMGDQGCVLLRVARLHVALSEERVNLDLVDRGRDGCVLAKRIEVVHHEVADADCANLAIGEKALERAIRLECLREVRGQSLMEDEEVDLVDAELACAV